MPTNQESAFSSEGLNKSLSELKSEAPRELTFGEKAVGLTFNPGGHGAVNEIKRKAADYIDSLNEMKQAAPNGEVARMLSIAITEAQTSQMWAVKAVTWQY